MNGFMFKGSNTKITHRHYTRKHAHTRFVYEKRYESQWRKWKFVAAITKLCCFNFFSRIRFDGCVRPCVRVRVYVCIDIYIILNIFVFDCSLHFKRVLYSDSSEWNASFGNRTLYQRNFHRLTQNGIYPY